MKQRVTPLSRDYDDPRIGYKRHTFHVKVALLERFKRIARLEKKTLIEALEEALENWTGYETESSDKK